MMILVYTYITLSYSIIKDEQANLTNPFLMSSLYQVSSWLSRTFFVPEIFLTNGSSARTLALALDAIIIPNRVPNVKNFFRDSELFRISLDGLIFLSVNANGQVVLPHSLWAHYTLV